MILANHQNDCDMQEAAAAAVAAACGKGSVKQEDIMSWRDSPIGIATLDNRSVLMLKTDLHYRSVWLI